MHLSGKTMARFGIGILILFITMMGGAFVAGIAFGPDTSADVVDAVFPTHGLDLLIWAVLASLIARLIPFWRPARSSHRERDSNVEQGIPTGPDRDRYL